MAQLIVHHQVQDYAKWRVVYDSADSIRRSYGETGARVFHTHNNSNEIVIITDWPSADQARAYSQSPELKEAMQKAGVTSQPEVLILEEMK
jgi:heme-degrading monooxygenase HmoA